MMQVYTYHINVRHKDITGINGCRLLFVSYNSGAKIRQ